MVFRKQPTGRWLCALDIWNTDAPAKLKAAASRSRATVRNPEVHKSPNDHFTFTEAHMYRIAKHLRAATAGVVVAYLGAANQVATAQQNSAEQQLVQLERDWCTAQLKKDAGLLGRILADDYTGVGRLGKKRTKAEELTELTDKTSTTTSCVDNDVKVRVYGDAAVVTGRASRAGTEKGSAFKDREFLWTDTFIKKDGRWQCVASQSTSIAP